MGILFLRVKFLSCYVRLSYCDKAQTSYMERVCGETNSVMYLEEGGRKK